MPYLWYPGPASSHSLQSNIGTAVLAATKQPNEWFSRSVRRSVRLSVRHNFLIMFPSSYHHEIFRSYYHWQKWYPCKRLRSRGQKSRSQMSKQILPQFGRFHAVTPALFQRWLCNYAQSLNRCWRDALLFLRVFCQISRSHGTKNADKWCTKLEVA